MTSKIKPSVVKANKNLVFDYSTPFKKENLKYIDRKIKSSFIVYDNLYVDLIKKNNGLQKDVFKIISQSSLNEIFRNNYSIKRITNFVTSKDVTGYKRGSSISNGFDIKIIENKKITQRYFLKEVLNSKHIQDYRGGVNEFLALKLLESNGINIIKPHFASHIFEGKERSYLLLDFTNLITCDVAHATKMMSDKEFRILKNKLVEIEDKINAKAHIWDIEPQNIFIDYSKKPPKLYFSDPIFALLPENYSSFLYKYNKSKI